MFRKELKDKFEKIFAVKKVTYDRPAHLLKGSDLKAPEQECLFVDIQLARNTIKNGRAISKVTGVGTMFGNADKMPFGYFAKRIKQAKHDLSKDLFFFNIEESKEMIGDIQERAFNFIYFYSGQYDPDLGKIESIDLGEVNT